MTKLLASALVSLTVFSWPIDKVERSLAKFTSGESQCTAFAISDRPSRWITMAHCVHDAPHGLYTPTKNLVGDGIDVLYKTPGGDGVVVIEVAPAWALRVPALKLGQPPKRGDALLPVGYGGGAPMPLAYAGILIHPSIVFNGEARQFLSAPSMPGMSGGPIIDRHGKVVGIVSGGHIPTPAPVMVNYSPLYTTVAEVMQTYGK